MLKVQLIHSQAGVLNCDPDPDGLNEFQLELKRAKGKDGVFYEFGVNLKYNKAAREYIRGVYEQFGIEAVITVNIYEYDPNQYNWGNIYTGQLRLVNYEISQNSIKTNVEQIGLERKFLNLEKRDVDISASSSLNGISLPLNPTISLPLAPKTIKSKGLLKGSGNWIESGGGTITIGFDANIRLGDKISTSDFQNNFMGVDFWTEGELPQDTSNYTLKIGEGEAGAYVFDFSQMVFDLFVITDNLGGDGDMTSWTIKLLFQVNDGAITEVYAENFVDGEFDDTEDLFPLLKRFKFNEVPDVNSINETLNVGDEVYIWFDSDIDFEGSGEQNKMVAYKLQEGVEFTITGDTVFPETNCAGHLVHEFLERIVQYITDQPVCFKSDFFGRTDIGYAQDGDGSLLFVTNGANIRQIDKTIFGNWKEAFESLEAIYCIGWGFETDSNGLQIVRCENKEYFYDKNIEAINLGDVAELTKKVSEDRYYQQIEVGYPEIENINQVNGIDEFNTIRRYGSPITQVDNELSIVSKYRASGFEIESQRRLLGTTEESKLDDKNFLIAVLRDGAGGYRVEQGIDFTSVTGVFDPDTAYNIRIRPSQMIRNWAKVLAAIVLRNEKKTLSFTYGEMNYEISVDGVSEKDDIDLTSIESIWYNDEYEFESSFSSDQRLLLRQNINGTIKAKDWSGNEIEGFLLSLRNTIEEKKAKVTLLRVYREETNG